MSTASTSAAGKNASYVLFVLVGCASLPFLLGLLGKKTLILSWLLILVALANFLAAKFQADYVCDRNCDIPVLPDRGFDLLPDSTDNEVLTGMVDFAPGIALCLLAFSSYRIDERTRLKMIGSLIILFCLRFIVMQATGIPPAKYGNASVTYVESSISKLLPEGRNEKGRKSYYDLLFSGHMSLFLISLLWILKLHRAFEGPYRIFWAFFLVISVSFVGLGLIALRMHYTSDVIVGIIISSLLFLSVR